MEESVRASWSSRQLERQISTLYDDPQQLELGISSMGGASDENEPGTQVIELNTHASELNTHALELNNHAPELNNHAPELNNHAPELNNHALCEPKQLTDLPPDLQKQLTELKKRENKRQVICNLILALCAFHPMTKKEFSTYLNRKENYLKHEFLQPLINNKKLKYLYPELIRHPYQAYITNGNISVSD